jgi:hypothetical protein
VGSSGDWNRSYRLAELRFFCRTLQFADVGVSAAHNVAASHIVRNRRVSARLVNLEELASDLSIIDVEEHADRMHSAGKLLDLVHKLTEVRLCSERDSAASPRGLSFPS